MESEKEKTYQNWKPPSFWNFVVTFSKWKIVVECFSFEIFMLSFHIWAILELVKVMETL